MNDINKNSTIITNNYKKFGKLQIQSFQPRKSKAIIDEIDVELGQFYGLSAAELDFILNFDIKYRMG